MITAFITYVSALLLLLFYWYSKLSIPNDKKEQPVYIFLRFVASADPRLNLRFVASADPRLNLKPPLPSV